MTLEQARLSRVDAVSLHTQTSTTHAHTVALIIIEASDRLSHEGLHQLVASSLPQLARFRSRLVSKALGVGQPVWAEIDGYDPTPQIHRAAVRAPGGQREFADLIAQLSAGRQRGSQPLWEAWSIEGLTGGRWALAVKMSPVLNERDNGAASIGPRLLTSGPHDASPNNLPSEPSLGSAPSLGELVTDLVIEIVEHHVAGAWLIAEAVTRALEALHRRLRGTKQPDPFPSAVSSMSGPVPHTVFDAPLTQRRAVAFASIPLTDVETVSNAFGGSTANVFLAACTLSLRAWLQHYDSVPEDPLLMQVPLSLPAGDPAGSANPLTVGKIRLPVQLDDPVQVLTNLHTVTERLTIARRDNAETTNPVSDFATIVSLVPPSVIHTGMKLSARLGPSRWRAPNCHGTVSYISGNRGPAYCVGSAVVGMHTVAPLLQGRGLNIAVTSHNDVMDLCVCVCPDNVPAVDDIATGIAESVDLLVAAAHESPRGHGRSVVSEMRSHVKKRLHAQRY
jgi:diacylglycerol O-acyltransferase / wax synthase